MSVASPALSVRLRGAPSRLRAILFRRALVRSNRPGETPWIVFAIPLVGRKRSADWGRVCRLLQGTLLSLRRQGYPHMRIYLCCQDRPACFDDRPEHVFVRAPEDLWLNAQGSDKVAKHRMLLETVAARETGFRYVMFLDGDDVLNPGLCRHVAQDNNGRGYLIERGYMLDARSGRIARLGGAGREPFWRQCGSCALFAVDFRRWYARRYLRALGTYHPDYAERAARLGFPLATVPFPAAIYVYATGENLSKRHTGGPFKEALLRSRVLGPAEARDVAYEFGLPNYPALVANGSAPAG